jgi:hypothetical protein
MRTVHNSPGPCAAREACRCLADLIGRVKTKQIHYPDCVDDQVHDVPLRQLIHHVERQQEVLTAVRFAKEMGY